MSRRQVNWSAATRSTEISSTPASLLPALRPARFPISGNFTQLSTGHLAIELGGLTAGVNYDRLQVSGTATLAGALDVTLINGFCPRWAISSLCSPSVRAAATSQPTPG